MSQKHSHDHTHDHKDGECSSSSLSSSSSSHAHSHFGHSHHHHHHVAQGSSVDASMRSSQAIFRAIVVTSIFMAVELIGGWLSNSLALISDAAHMLTDVGAMFLSLFALWVARRPVTRTMSFGYHRAE